MIKRMDFTTDKQYFGNTKRFQGKYDQPICYKFASGNTCDHKENCKFKHIKICTFYARNGNCRNGDQCRFSHNTSKICRMNIKGEHCTYGLRCKFIHINRDKDEIKYKQNEVRNNRINQAMGIKKESGVNSEELSTNTNYTRNQSTNSISAFLPKPAIPHSNSITKENDECRVQYKKGKKTKKTRRGNNICKKIKHFKVYYLNIRGYKSKMDTLMEIINSEKPDVIGLVETMLAEKEKVEINGYFIVRNDRNAEGGGTMFAIRNEYKHITIEVNRSEKDFREGSLWIVLGTNNQVRIVLLYNPQEMETTESELQSIYNRITEEIWESKNKNQKFILMGDFNNKVGNIIKGNSDIITKGGKLLIKLIQKHNLSIVNTMNITKGIWTRTMISKNKNEKSVLDYMIINKNDEDCILKFTVDENKTLASYRLLKEKGEVKLVYSDHNALELCTDWKKQFEKERDIERTQMTKTDYNKYRKKINDEKISNIIMQAKDVQVVYDNWTTKINEIKKSCEIKRTNKNKNKTTQILMKSRRDIKKQIEKGKIRKLCKH